MGWAEFIAILRTITKLVDLLSKWFDLREPVWRAERDKLLAEQPIYEEAEEVARANEAIDNDVDGSGAASALLGDDGLLVPDDLGVQGGPTTADSDTRLRDEAEAAAELGLSEDLYR